MPNEQAMKETMEDKMETEIYEDRGGTAVTVRKSKTRTNNGDVGDVGRTLRSLPLKDGHPYVSTKIFMYEECNARDCFHVPSVYICKAWYCYKDSMRQIHIRKKLEKYKALQDLHKELKWRIKEAKFRKRTDAAHRNRIAILQETLRSTQ